VFLPFDVYRQFFFSTRALPARDCPSSDEECSKTDREHEDSAISIRPGSAEVLDGFERTANRAGRSSMNKLNEEMYSIGLVCSDP
jgi:hypothetical protein